MSAVMEERPAVAVEGHEMYERIAKLESDVAHIRTDVSELKVSQQRLQDRIDFVYMSLSSRIDALTESVHQAKIWALLIAAALLGVMARGFGWF